MAYKYDTNLNFLEKCTNEELENLYDILVYDKDGEKRWTESLSTSAEYKIYGRDYSKYWRRIAEEYQHFGGNTLANLFRSTGVEYSEILNDVLSNLKISYSSYESIEERENKLLLKVFEEYFSHLSEEEKIKLIKEMGINSEDLKKGSIFMIVQAILKMGGFGTYKIVVIIANYITRMFLNRGLSLTANAALTRTVSVFLGPIGWTITGIWTLLDIASPAFRVTFPATAIISCLRRISEERIREELEFKRVENIVKCEKCGTRLRIKESGKKYRCPECGDIFVG